MTNPNNKYSIYYDYLRKFKEPEKDKQNMILPNKVHDMKQHLIICDRCKKSKYIPFQPQPGAVVFCKECYTEMRGQEAVWFKQGLRGQQGQRRPSQKSSVGEGH